MPLTSVVLEYSSEPVSLPQSDVWLWNTGTAEVDPNVRFVALNNATVSAVTEMFVSEFSSGLEDVSAGILSFLSSGRSFTLHEQAAPSSVATFTVTGAPVDNGTWWSVPVVFVSDAAFTPGASTSQVLTVLPAWTTVPLSELRRVEWWMGTGSEGDDPEEGGATIELVNVARKWEPLFGSNVIDTHQRFRLTLNGTREGVWFITNITIDYPGNTEWSVVEFQCAGGFEVLALDHLPSLDPPDAESYEDVVNFDEPWGYWRLGEAEGTSATARIVKTWKGRGKNRRKIKRRRGTAYQTREEAGGVSGPAGIYKGLPALGEAGLVVGDTDASVLFEAASSQWMQAAVEDENVQTEAVGGSMDPVHGWGGGQLHGGCRP